MATIAILGLSILGSSLGLALRKHRAWSDVIGYDAYLPNQRSARRLGAIARDVASIADAFAQADVVILTTPALESIEILRDTAGKLRPGAVVTDTGVTKTAIAEAAMSLLPAGVAFVGGHPIVDVPESTSMELASPDLFLGHPWFVVPTASSSATGLDVTWNMAEAAGARPLFVDLAEHESWSAWVDQLPIVLAMSILLSSETSGAWPEMQRMASQRFRDCTAAVAGSSSEVRDALLTNREVLLSHIDGWLLNAQRLRAAIDSNDRAEVEQILATCRELRDSWFDAERRGFPGLTNHVPSLPKRSNFLGKAFSWRRPS